MVKSMLKKYLSNCTGNVGVMFGVMALPVTLMMGGAIDLLRISNSEAKLQSAVEAGVLSAASLTSTQSVEDAVKDYVDANVGDDPTLQNIKITIEKADLKLNQRQVQVKAEAEVPLSFLAMIGDSTQQIEVVAEAIEAKQTLELSMVLDVSSSMSGNRLKNLKTAASSFVDQMLTPERVDYTSINLVPFGGTVNLGTLFDNYVVPTGAAITDPDKTSYSIGAGIATGNFRFSDGKECVELIKEDFDLDDIPNHSRSQIPHFWKYRNFNPWCPDEGSMALWNTNDADALKKRITEFTLSDGTGMDHGILWGAKALSPSLKGKLGGQFPTRPNEFGNSEVQKIMVLMTDGGITFQGRPKDYSLYSVHTSKKNNKNQQTYLKGGGKKALAGHNSAVGNFKTVCDDLKAQGVVIYTIGFQIKANSTAEVLLKYCASNQANYYLVESLDISKAFNAIALAMQKLRVSG